MIEVFADVCCPFTHVGLRRLVDQRQQRFRDDVVLCVRAWPLELVNGVALDPAMVADEVDVLRRDVAPDLFEGFDPDRFPATSRPAFALAAAAYRRDQRTGEAVSLTLRDLLFEHGADIADPDVLGEVEREFELRVLDVDVASVELDHREGRGRGVIGSPHFFTSTGSFFCPSLKIARDRDGALHIEPGGDVDGFLAACFA